MNKIRFYTTIGLLSTNLFLTSCASQIKEEPQEYAKSVSSVGRTIAEEAERIAQEKIEREREEQAAFEKAILNPEFIDTDEFKSVNKVSIEWNDIRQVYIVQCSNDETLYTIPLPEERLISYMLRNCNLESLAFYSPKDATILEELANHSNLKELHIYDTDISDFSVLRKYSGIEGIRLQNCENLSDISFFEDLKNITAVEIAGTKVSDIEPLSNCTKLTSAKLRCNQITNPETLNNLENLTYITLVYNKIEDVKQLDGLVKKGIMSKEQAEDVVETTTNHMLIFSSGGEELTGESLEISYFDAIKEYYCEVMDAEGNVVAYICTDEPYNFYDISKKMGEKKSLRINNFPEDGYIHHLSDEDKFETVIVYNCDFDYFPLSNFDNVVSLGIHNCPNLVNTFKETAFFNYNKELKYICVKNSGINTIERLGKFRNLEIVDLEDNNISDYDVLKSIKNLKSATITLDNPDYDYSSLQELVDNGVEINVYLGVEKTPTQENTDKTPLAQQRVK